MSKKTNKVLFFGVFTAAILVSGCSSTQNCYSSKESPKPVVSSEAKSSAAIIPETPASTNSIPILSGKFTQGTWSVDIKHQSNDYQIAVKDDVLGSSVFLNKIKVVQNSNHNGRYIYSGKKDGFQYIVAWRPNKPHWIRLQILNRDGKETFNKFLKKKN